MSVSEDDLRSEYDNYESDFINDNDDDHLSNDQLNIKHKKRHELTNNKSLKKRKQRKTASFFIEDQAAEDSNEESGSDDELTAREREEAARQREELEKQYKRKTHGPSFLEYEGEDQVEEYFNRNSHIGEYEENDEEALLPTAKDPKLFAVKCKHNHEREACSQIMKKYFDCLGTPAEFQIFSCNAIDRIKGYIYIEAFSDKHVYMAIADIPVIFGSKISLVSLADRVQIFENDSTKAVEVKIGQWARIKKGLYEGDLAQVEDVDDAKGRVYVKLVPRLPPPSDDGGSLEIEEENAESKIRSGHLKKSKTATRNKIRPAQRFFQVNEYQGWSYHRDSERGITFILYQGNKFCDGLLYKWFPLKNLITQNINVTYDESKYLSIDDNTDPAVLNTLIEQVTSTPSKFFKGDRIRVTKGDLVNLEAEIMKVNESTLTVKPTNTDFIETVEILPSDCVKIFNKGDYVRVLEGKSAGKEGFVLSIVDNIATVISDGLQNVIKTSVNDLVFCNESTRNIDTGKEGNKSGVEYVKYDLVKLTDRKTVGIVLGPFHTGWKILDNYGNVRNVNAYQIEQKLNTRNNITKNDKEQIFKTNDSVRVLQGKYKGQTGIAKQVYNDLIFIYNPDVTQHMGIIVEKANNCYLLSSQRQGRSRLVGPKGKDNIVGKKCVIKSGPWKGYQGVVTDVNENTARVELTAKCEIIDVKKDLVAPIDEMGKVNEANTVKNIEPKTPMLSRFPQSPLLSMDSPGFFNSPAW